MVNVLTCLYPSCLFTKDENKLPYSVKPIHTCSTFISEILNQLNAILTYTLCLWCIYFSGEEIMIRKMGDLLQS